MDASERVGWKMMDGQWLTISICRGIPAHGGVQVNLQLFSLLINYRLSLNVIVIYSHVLGLRSTLEGWKQVSLHQNFLFRLPLHDRHHVILTLAINLQNGKLLTAQ